MKHQPWHPIPFTDREAYALKAWAEGTATDIQQKLAFDWIMKACRLRDETFVEGKSDVSFYLQGKRAVGLNIVAAINSKPKGEPPIG